MADIVSNMAPIIIACIVEGYAKQDCVLRAKRRNGITRPLTEQEKLALAQELQKTYHQISIEDFLYSINLADSMDDYSTGGGLNQDTDLSPDLDTPYLDQQIEQEQGRTKKYILYIVIAFALLTVLKK